MEGPPDRRPGDLLIKRYLPDADEETQELAREAFRGFACLLIRIGERIMDERGAGVDSPAEPGRRTMEDGPSGAVSNSTHV